MSWFKDIFGKRGAPTPAVAGPLVAEEPTSEAPPVLDEPDPIFHDNTPLRVAYWAGVGRSESDVLTFLISPQFHGGSVWPTTRQAYRVIRTDRSTIMASEGLSEPFDDVEGGESGFGMELYLETRDLAPEIVGSPGQIMSLKTSWVFIILQHVAVLVADAGGVVGQLEKYGVLSVELPGFDQSPEVVGQVPVSFRTEDGALGLLLGISAIGRSEQIANPPYTSIRMVAITLITAKELEAIRKGGDTARNALAAQLSAKPDGHFSDLNRASLA